MTCTEEKEIARKMGLYYYLLFRLIELSAVNTMASSNDCIVEYWLLVIFREL